MDVDIKMMDSSNHQSKKYLMIIGNKFKFLFLFIIILSIWLYFRPTIIKVYGDENILKDIMIYISIDDGVQQTIFQQGKLIPFEINKNSGIFTLYVSYKNKYFAKKSSDNTLQGEWDYVNHIYIDNNESGIFFQNIRLKRSIKDRDKYPKIKLELK